MQQHTFFKCAKFFMASLLIFSSTQASCLTFDESFDETLFKQTKYTLEQFRKLAILKVSDAYFPLYFHNQATNNNATSRQEKSCLIVNQVFNTIERYMDKMFELSKQYNNQTLKIQNDFKDTQTIQKKFQQLNEEIQLKIKKKEKKLCETKKQLIKTLSSSIPESAKNNNDLKEMIKIINRALYINQEDCSRYIENIKKNQQEFLSRIRKEEAEKRREEAEKEEERKREEQERIAQRKEEQERIAQRKEEQERKEREKIIQKNKEEQERREQERKEQERMVDVTQIANSIYDLGQMILMINSDQKFRLSPTFNCSWYENTSSNDIKSTGHSLQIPVSFSLKGAKLSIAYIYNSVDGNMGVKPFKQNAHTGMLHIHTPTFLYNTAAYGFISYTKGSEKIGVSKDNKNMSCDKLESNKIDSSDFTMLLWQVGIADLYNTKTTLAILGDVGLRGYSLYENNKHMGSEIFEGSKKHETLSLFVSIAANFKISEIMYIRPFISTNISIVDNKTGTFNKKNQSNDTKEKNTDVPFMGVKAGLNASGNFNGVYFNINVTRDSTKGSSLNSIAVTFGAAL